MSDGEMAFGIALFGLASCAVIGMLVYWFSVIAP